MKNLSISQLIRSKNSVPFSDSLNKWVENEFLKVHRNLKIDHIIFVDYDPYTRHIDMFIDVRENKQLKISTLHSDSSIFGKPETNHKFRAVHDSHHILLDMDFTVQSELIITAKMLKEYRKAGLSQYDIDLLTIEMNEQIIYFNETGNFPTNQRLFTLMQLKKYGYN